MIWKRCGETGCTGGRCRHTYYLKVVHNGEEERGPFKRFAFLLEDHERLEGHLKADAEELERRLKTWLIKGRRGAPVPRPPDAPDPPPPPSDPTIAEAATAYLHDHVAGLKGVSDEGIVRRIIRALGARPLTDLCDRAVLRDYLAEVREHSGPVAANRNYARWSHLLNWCRGEYQLAGPTPFYHPSLNRHGVKKSVEGVRDRRLADGEEDALIRGCQAIADGGLMLGRLYCALDAGLRRGEMLQLTREDVIRHAHGLALRVRWETAKTNRERKVPVTSERLEQFLNARRFAPFPFGDADGRELVAFRWEWWQVLIAAGMAAGKHRRGPKGPYWEWSRPPDLTWHDLRHECGSRLAEGRPPDQAPVPLTEIRELLGHSSLTTTQRYLNPTLSSLAANMRRIHRARGL